MSENTTAVETPAMSAEEIAKAIDALPDFLRDAIKNLNSNIEQHNAKVTAITSAEKKDAPSIKAEIFEQKHGDSKKLSVLWDQKLKLEEQLEKLIGQAYGLIESEGLMPKELTEDELNKLKNETQESNKEFKAQIAALLKMEEMSPMFKGKLSPLITDVKTRRGTAKTGGTSSGQAGTRRPRFKKILINGTDQDGNGNTVYQMVNGEPKYTFTFASQYLRKQHKGISVTQAELGDLYYAGIDENNEPNEHTFQFPFTYNDENGNEQTVNYEIKTFK
jgi:hypothetical protein